jgi:hypothetical protein
MCDRWQQNGEEAASALFSCHTLRVRPDPTNGPPRQRKPPVAETQEP